MMGGCCRHGGRSLARRLQGQDGAEGGHAAIAMQDPAPMRQPVVGRHQGYAVARNGYGATLREHHERAIRFHLVARRLAVVAAAAGHAVALAVLGVVLARVRLVRLREGKASPKHRSQEKGDEGPHGTLPATWTEPITTQCSECS